MKQSRLTALDIKSRKNKEPLVVLTAYTYPIATILDEHVDVLLVGDSLGMVVYGMDSTLQVSLDMMVNHGKAVVKGSKKACVVVDLPFGSYQGSPEAAYNAAAFVLAETGCSAVKLEGGVEMAETVQFLSQRGIPVMGHIGLKPQYFNVFGGYKYQGRTQEDENKIMDDAQALQEAGCFSIVIESVIEKLARNITRNLLIPTIGIGASPACDGQVLVVDDMLGVTANPPSFVKQYAHLSDNIRKAVVSYKEEVHEGRFPTGKHCYSAKKAVPK